MRFYTCLKSQTNEDYECMFKLNCSLYEKWEKIKAKNIVKELILFIPKWSYFLIWSMQSFMHMSKYHLVLKPKSSCPNLSRKIALGSDNNKYLLNHNFPNVIESMANHGELSSFVNKWYKHNILIIQVLWLYLTFEIISNIFREQYMLFLFISLSKSKI